MLYALLDDAKYVGKTSISLLDWYARNYVFSLTIFVYMTD